MDKIISRRFTDTSILPPPVSGAITRYLGALSLRVVPDIRLGESNAAQYMKKTSMYASDAAKHMMHNSAFTCVPSVRTASLLILPRGLVLQEAKTLFKRLTFLQYCPCEVGPAVRLQYLQPYGERLVIWHQPIADQLFVVENTSRGAWILGSTFVTASFPPSARIVVALATEGY
ncbi:MAG: hypothetical protein B7X04_02900 [Parcubacteria group bacterium 21-54-25]|nr:MAG: hypothetical protein B7X04_02900 [Parcubacteria group bacterium 21-54-25]HQU07908.1 hypothetical protein [Candidatus Paceibacterota bacterium]